MTPANIIFLTGTSSSGKTSIAKSLQRELPQPYLHMQLDSFIEMMPRQGDDLFNPMLHGFHRSIAAMASAGNRLIVDHVLLLPEWLHECAALLSGYSVLLVGVICPLEELERREKQRDPRRQGFARSQFEAIHKDRTYDIEVHTDRFTPDECAQQILAFYNDATPSASMQNQPLR